MNHIQKFNRALLKAIGAQKIVVADRNSGATREAVVKFSFSHDGVTHFYALSSERTAPGLDMLGYDAPHKLSLVAYNASFTSGAHEDMPEGVDASAIKYIESCSVISEEDATKAREILVEAFNRFSVEMCLPH
jgi:hypothetical protein